MAAKKRGLGRGLDALLGGAGSGPRPPAGTPEGAAAGGDVRGCVQGELRHLPVDRIRRGRYQPRTHMDAASLEELANSIRAQGVVQPIVVRPLGVHENGNELGAQAALYEIIAGERRWRAAQLAGLHEIPAVVRAVPDQAAMAMALIENIQRENLNPMEEAQALARLIDEFGLTHQDAAQAVGRSRAAVSNLLRLLELEEEVKALVERGELEMGHARALLGLRGRQQREAARQVAARGLSVRETERLVRRLQRAPHVPREGTAESAPRGGDPDIRRLEEELSARLGAQVRLQHRAGGKGRLVIRYTSLEELEGILQRIQ